MRPKDKALAERIVADLRNYERAIGRLPGITSTACRSSLVEQILESMHRVDYVHAIQRRPISSHRCDPGSSLFDPLRAAVIHRRAGDYEESFWLVFLATYFGKHRHSGWRLCRDIYGGLAKGGPWTWNTLSRDVAAFDKWLSQSLPVLEKDGVRRHFGNHRKYETLKPSSGRSTAKVFASYVQWAEPYGGQAARFSDAISESNEDPTAAFDLLYRSMDSVISFGRTGRFDFLTMVSDIGLAAVQPGSAYLSQATGPRRGARLLFGGPPNGAPKSYLDDRLIELDGFLNLGMKVLEDALCNWQKSSTRFEAFRG